MSHHNVSKSTTRRCFLEEIEVLDFFVENQEPHSSFQLTTSHNLESNLILENSNPSSIVSHINDNNSLANHNNIVDSNYSDLNNAVLDYSSDYYYEYFSSDSDSEFVINGNDILDNK